LISPSYKLHITYTIWKRFTEIFPCDPSWCHYIFNLINTEITFYCKMFDLIIFGLLFRGLSRSLAASQFKLILIRSIFTTFIVLLKALHFLRTNSGPTPDLPRTNFGLLFPVIVLRGRLWIRPLICMKNPKAFTIMNIKDALQNTTLIHFMHLYEIVARKLCWFALHYIKNRMAHPLICIT